MNSERCLIKEHSSLIIIFFKEASLPNKQKKKKISLVEEDKYIKDYKQRSAIEINK